MNSIRFVEVMNNTTIINTLNSVNSNIAKIKAQYCQIMTTITNWFLEFKPMVKIPIVVKHSLLLLLFLAGSSQSYNISTFIRPIHKTKKLIRLKKMFTKIIYYLLVSNFISAIL